MPLRILRAARAGQREPRPGLPRHRDVLDVLPRHALPRARPPLQRAADRRGVPALDAHRRRPLAGRHRAARRALRRRFAVLTAGMASAAAGLLLFATVGPDTAFFPTVFFACFAIGLGIGNAFMPLLTLAMADVPAADAGLGSGHHQRLPADQRRARPGRARARSPPTTRRACWPTDHGLGRLADRRLPGRVHHRGGRHRRRDRARVRAARPRPAAGAAARRGPRPVTAPAPHDHLRHGGPGSMKQPNPTTPRKPRARRRRVQRVFDGVVASYIHEQSRGGPIRFRVHPTLIRGRSIVQISSRRAENRCNRRRAGVPSRPMHSGRRLLVAVVLALAPAVPAAAAPTTTVQRTIFDCDGDNLLDLTLRRAAPSVRPGIPARGGRGRPVARPAFGAGDEPRLQPSASIINFLQLSDFQTVDEESPARVEWLDATQRIAGLQPLSAALPAAGVASRNADHRGDGPSRRGKRAARRWTISAPLDMTLRDQATTPTTQQYNETRWFIDISRRPQEGRPELRHTGARPVRRDARSAAVPRHPGSVYDGVRDSGDREEAPDFGDHEPNSARRATARTATATRRAARTTLRETPGRDVTVRDFPGLFECGQPAVPGRSGSTCPGTRCSATTTR